MVKIRLMRMGAKKRPFYRVVVADARSPRDGRFIENIGKYHPLSNPSVIDIDEERALHWLREGAQPTESARNLLTKVGIWSRFTGEPVPAPISAPAEAAETADSPAEEPVATSEPSAEEAGETAESPPEEAGETAESPPEEAVAQAPGGRRAAEAGGDEDETPGS